MFYKIDQVTLQTVFMLIKKGSHANYSFEQIENTLNSLRRLEKVVPSDPVAKTQEKHAVKEPSITSKTPPKKTIKKQVKK